MLIIAPEGYLFDFFNMKVYCVFSESPHRSDSNEYTEYTIFEYKKEKQPKLSRICNSRIFSMGLQNEFEIAVVNEPSVFEPLKFYCIPNSILPFQYKFQSSTLSLSDCMPLQNMTDVIAPSPQKEQGNSGLFFGYCRGFQNREERRWCSG